MDVAVARDYNLQKFDGGTCTVSRACTVQYNRWFVLEWTEWHSFYATQEDGDSQAVT